MITIPAAVPDRGRVHDDPLVRPPARRRDAGHYALYRSTAATCTTANGVKWADYLTSPFVFTYTPQSSQSLGKLAVALTLNLRRSGSVGIFKLQDNIVLRNSTRTCISGSPSPPC